jgi:hypothetical protein
VAPQHSRGKAIRQTSRIEAPEVKQFGRRAAIAVPNFALWPKDGGLAEESGRKYEVWA